MTTEQTPGETTDAVQIAAQALARADDRTDGHPTPTHLRYAQALVDEGLVATEREWGVQRPNGRRLWYTSRSQADATLTFESGSSLLSRGTTDARPER